MKAASIRSILNAIGATNISIKKHFYYVSGFFDMADTELRKKRGGELEPSSHESWLDVEARAVGQAAAAIKVIVSVGQREAGKKLLLTVSPF